MLHGPLGHRMTAVLAIILLVARVLHAGGMLGFVPYGRSPGASGTTSLLAVASVMLDLAGISGALDMTQAARAHGRAGHRPALAVPGDRAPSRCGRCSTGC